MFYALAAVGRIMLFAHKIHLRRSETTLWHVLLRSSRNTSKHCRHDSQDDDIGDGKEGGTCVSTRLGFMEALYWILRGRKFLLDRVEARGPR
jgi:hypothetical protein